MVALLAWLWLQSQQPRTRAAMRHIPGNDSPTLVFATAGWFTMLSIVLFVVHFAVPAEERKADAIWSHLGNLSFDDQSFNASEMYMGI